MWCNYVDLKGNFEFELWYQPILKSNLNVLKKAAVEHYVYNMLNIYLRYLITTNNIIVTYWEK